MTKTSTALAMVAPLFLTLNAAFLVGAEVGSPVRLVTEGRPAAVLVLPDAAADDSVEREAATILSAHLYQMSGARLPIVRESDLRGLKVENGRALLPAPPVRQQLPDDDTFGNEHVPGETRSRLPFRPASFVMVGAGKLAGELGVSAQGLGVGGIRVKTSGNVVVLLGGAAAGGGVKDPFAVRNAAVELLEQLGFRYLWPGELGKVVPKRSTVEIPPLDIAYTPAIGQRHLRMLWGARIVTYGRHRNRTRQQILRLAMSTWQAGFDKAAETQSPGLWTAWQRVDCGYGFVHNAGGVGRDPEVHQRLLQTHPEWFALQGDGTRDQRGHERWRLCMSNPHLVAYVAEHIIRQKQEDKDLALVSLCPNDGGLPGWCMCARCRALDPPEGARIITRILEPAGADQPLPPPAARLDTTQLSLPGIQRSTIDYVSLTDRVLSYSNGIAARVNKVHPDLLFGVSAYSVFTHAPLREKLHPNMVVRYVSSGPEEWEDWEKAGARRIFWRPNILLMNRRHGKLQSIAGRMAENMHFFSEKGVNQTDFDSIFHHWSTFGLTYYATARLNWNPRLTFAEILADYVRHGFGKGAEHVRKYFLRIEEMTAAGIAGMGHETAADYRYTPAVAAELRGLLDAAEREAADDDVSARIAFLRLGLNMTELWEKLDDKARRAANGEPVDRALARRLLDLNALALRDIVANHHFALNVVGLAHYSNAFSKWTPLEADTEARVLPSERDLFERVATPRYGLSGKEKGLEDMLQAFGL